MTGFAPTLRLAWRRSRVFYLCWVLGLISLLPLTASKYHEIVPEGTNAEVMMAMLGANPTMRAILGPPYDLMTAGGFTFWRVGTFTAAAVAMMAALGVVRGTRAEEEEGRDELIRAGVVGRHVPLAAALTLAGAACAAIALATVGGMVAMGTPLAGSIASGLGLGLTGAMFAGVAAVFAQVFESARTVRSWTLGIALGGGYLVRAIIDGTGEGSALEPLQWAMPLEWAALVRPYANERWWVFLLPVALAAVLVAAAFALEARRDHGAGLVAARPGPATASGSLGTVWGLAWRLQRGSVIGWTIGILTSAIAMGSLAGSVEKMVTDNTQLAEMFRKLGGDADSLKEAFFVAMLGIMGTVISVLAVQMLSRLRSEETGGRAELMLSTSVSRYRFAVSHLALALAVPSVLLVATGALTPLVNAIAAGDASTMGVMAEAALVFVVGVVLIVGIAMVLIGWLPGWFGVAWGVLGWSIFAAWIGALFDLPEWLLKAHPWGHLPHLPTDDMAWTPVLIELAIGVGLIVVGLLGYRRRNIPMM